MRAFDADEDESLTIDEILAAAPGSTAPVAAEAPIVWRAAKDTQEPDGVWSIALGKSSQKVELRDVVATAFEPLADDARRIRYRDGTISLGPLNAGPAARFSSTREFYLAPFKSAVGDKGDKQFLERKEIEDDPALAFLAGLFAHADRNGDNRLTLAELEAFLDLIEAGLRAQVVITVRDQGKNLFLLLDENQDGKLDLRELTRAARALPLARRASEGVEPKFLSRSDIPRQVTISIEQGPASKTFGPVLLSGAAKPSAKAKAKSPAARGPNWFQAMDRNGDGYLSPREFFGPPETFAALDADGDGFISVEEAERADGKGKKR